MLMYSTNSLGWSQWPHFKCTQWLGFRCTQWPQMKKKPKTLWDEPNDLISNVPNDLGFDVPNDLKWRKNQKVFNQTLITFCHFKITEFWQMGFTEKWTVHRMHVPEFLNSQNSKFYSILKFIFHGGAPPKWPIFSRLRSYQSKDFKISFGRW